MAAPPNRTDLAALLHGGRATLLTRRSVLRGAAALGAVGVAGGLGLGACGGDDEEGSSSNTTGSDTPSLALLTLLDSAASLAAGSEARLPLGLGDSSGNPVDNGPEQLTFTVTTAEGATVARDIKVPLHAEGLPLGYYPVRFTPEAAGDHIARTTVGSETIETAFTVSEAADIVIPQPGQPFPAAATPTTTDARGVDPICTREPQCELHVIDLEAVLGTSPLAVLVSTPAFCQQAICGPVLDVLLDSRSSAPEVTYIHVEVFASATEVESEGTQAALAPAVETWKLPFEPCLFLVGRDGVLVSRLDVVFDEKELVDSLAELSR